MKSNPIQARLIEYKEAVVRKSQIEATIKLKVDEINALYASELDTLNLTISSSQTAIKTYVEKNAKKIFGDETGKAEFSNVSYGIRLCPSSLSIVATTIEDVISSIKKRFKTSWKTYVRVKEEMDKNALKKLEPDVLSELGLSLVQEKKFFIEISDTANQKS